MRGRSSGKGYVTFYVLVDDPDAYLTRQPEPPILVLNEPNCYHFRVLDPHLPLRRGLRELSGSSRLVPPAEFST
ncbi:MAG: hypothetical protein M3T56_11950 [Chloroflexota bacterium]|nr:hypothetical protein [Chloroflexota bacterium]